MNNEHDHHSITNTLSQFNFLLYSTLCIICIFLSFRHIKHHRRCWPQHCHPNRRSTDTAAAGIHPSIPPERQKNMPETNSKTSGKAMASQQISQPSVSGDAYSPNQGQEYDNDNDQDQDQDQGCPRHQSGSSPACEILQPLSQLVPVPASGRVAAAVTGGETTDLGLDLDLSLPTAATDACTGAAEQDDPSSSRTHIPGPEPKHTYEPQAIKHTRHQEENSSNAHPHPHLPIHPLNATHTPILAGPGPSAPDVAVRSPAVASSLGQHYPSIQSTLSNTEPHIQKRSETVQMCRDVDAEGVRSWRRLIVEYG